MPGAGMIAMGMSDQSPFDRASGINVKITCLTVKTERRVAKHFAEFS